jgi:hypothetical protein
MALTACGTSTVEVAAPDLTEARSMVLAVSALGRFEVHAIDLAAPESIEIRALSSADRILIEAFLYSLPLAELGISAGLLSSDPGGRALEDPSTGILRAFRAEGLEDGELAQWSEAVELSNEARAFRLPRGPTPCASFERIVISLEVRDRAAFVLPLDDRRAIASTLGGSTFVVTSSGSTPSTPLTEFQPSSGARIGEELWIASAAGSLATVTVTSTGGLALERRGQRATAGRTWWLSGGASGSSAEVLSLSFEGVVERFFAGRSTILHRFPGNAGSSRLAGLSWTGPGRALAVSSSTRELVRVTGDDVSGEQAPGRATPTSVAHLPSLGDLYGDSSGAIFLDRGEGWSALSGNPARLRIMSFAEYEDGFVFGSEFGNFAQYVDGFGFCPLEQHAGYDLRIIRRIGQDLVLFGDPTEDGRSSIVYLRRLDSR